MKTTDTAWLRLVKAARQDPAPSQDETAPFGFSTRVAALGMAQLRATPTWQVALGLSAWRALGVAVMLMAVSIVANYSVSNALAETDQETVLDPVADVLTSS